MIEFITAFINSVDSIRDQIFLYVINVLFLLCNVIGCQERRCKRILKIMYRGMICFLNTKFTNLTVKIGPVTDLSDSLKEL